MKILILFVSIWLLIEVCTAKSHFEKSLTEDERDRKYSKHPYKSANRAKKNNVIYKKVRIPNGSQLTNLKNSERMQKLHLRKKRKVDVQNNGFEKNFLQLHSKTVYDPSLFFRNEDNPTMGMATLYYSRLVWVCFLLLIIFLLICIIGVYLYIENLKFSPPQRKILEKSSATHYISNRHGNYLQTS